jgi:hypothetical protein
MEFLEAAFEAVGDVVADVIEYVVEHGMFLQLFNGFDQAVFHDDIGEEFPSHAGDMWPIGAGQHSFTSILRTE